METSTPPPSYFTLKKMQTSCSESGPIEYSLIDQSGSVLSMNGLIGQTLKLEYHGNIQCMACQKTIKKSYQQGYCFPCTQKLAACDLCIVKPERCHFHLGTCREPSWGKSFCMQPHVVYLAYTSQLKIGITRQTQIPYRWIDQGALAAIPLFTTHSRYHSGLLEIQLAKLTTDKTNWRQMLKTQTCPIHDLKTVAQTLCDHDNIQKLCQSSDQWPENQTPTRVLEQHQVTHNHFPLDQAAPKIVSFNLDKTPCIEGQLLGIKGQYLVFDTGVINIRKYGGYEVNIQALG